MDPLSSAPSFAFVVKKFLKLKLQKKSESCVLVIHIIKRHTVKWFPCLLYTHTHTHTHCCSPCCHNVSGSNSFLIFSSFLFFIFPSFFPCLSVVVLSCYMHLKATAFSGLPQPINLFCHRGFYNNLHHLLCELSSCWKKKAWCGPWHPLSSQIKW